VPLYPTVWTRPSARIARRSWLLSCVALGASACLTACDWSAGPPGAASEFKGIDLTGVDYARDFSLTDFDGVHRTMADYRGKVVMLYFGFVQCPDVCPTALTRAAEVLRMLGPEAAKRVQLLFITVDPERDTPELLREYMAAFDPSFVGLTGTPEQIRAAADAFRVVYRKVPTGSTYTMDHTALTYLFDTEGRVRVALRHQQTAAEYAADIQRLLTQADA
jgi:protein SCO1